MNAIRLLVIASALLLPGTMSRGEVMQYRLGDTTYGTSAIEITFLWDGNLDHYLTDFAWKTPFYSSSTYGTVSDTEVVTFDSIGYPTGHNMAAYLLSGDVAWSEDQWKFNWDTTLMAMNIRNPVAGTYGIAIDRNGALNLPPVYDAVHSGTLSLVNISAVPEPSTYAMAVAGLACGGWQIYRRRRTR